MKETICRGHQSVSARQVREKSIEVIELLRGIQPPEEVQRSSITYRCFNGTPQGRKMVVRRGWGNFSRILKDKCKQ